MIKQIKFIKKKQTIIKVTLMKEERDKDSLNPHLNIYPYNPLTEEHQSYYEMKKWKSISVDYQTQSFDLKDFIQSDQNDKKEQDEPQNNHQNKSQHRFQLKPKIDFHYESSPKQSSPKQSSQTPKFINNNQSQKRQRRGQSQISIQQKIQIQKLKVRRYQVMNQQKRTQLHKKEIQLQFQFLHKELDFKISVFNEFCENPNMFDLNNVVGIFEKRPFVYPEIHQTATTTKRHQISHHEKRQIKTQIKKKFQEDNFSILKLARLYNIHWQTAKKWIHQGEEQKKQKRQNNKK